MEQNKVIFEFADGLKGTIDNAYPVMREYGYGATAFIPTGQIGRANHMRINDLKRLVGPSGAVPPAWGWEVAFHGIAGNFDGATDEEVEAAMEAGRAWFDAAKLKSAVFGPPAGFWSQAWTVIAKRYGWNVIVVAPERGGTFPPYGWITGSIKCNDAQTLDYITGLLDRRRPYPTLFQMRFHNVKAQRDETWKASDTTVERLRAVCELVKDRGLPVVHYAGA